MRFVDPLLPIVRDEPKHLTELKRAIYEMERRRALAPTLTIGDGTTNYAAYDFVQFDGATITTVGSNGLKVTVSANPDYAFCTLSSTMSTITTVTKVTPLSTVLNGFTASSAVLTCTNGGKFALDMTCALYAGTVGDAVLVGYRINGGADSYVILHVPDTALYTKTVFGRAYLSLSASDTVEFRTARSGTGNAGLQAGARFSLIKVAT